MIRPACLLAALLVCAACGGPQHLAGDAALADSDYIALDLATGTVSAVATVDLADPRWHGPAMLFRRLAGGSCTVSGKALGPAQDPVVDPACTWTHSTCWVGVFEVTRAQWLRLSGRASDPLVAYLPAKLLAADDDMPITGISPEDARLAIASIRTSRFHLRLPTTGEWVGACSGGNDRLFAWGDGTGALVTGTYAVSDGATGPKPVGSLLPNAGGFFDMRGNAWEILDDAGVCTIRGGAWDVPAVHCRTSNRVAIPADLPHPTVGLRLVLTP